MPCKIKYTNSNIKECESHSNDIQAEEISRGIKLFRNKMRKPSWSCRAKVDHQMQTDEVYLFLSCSLLWTVTDWRLHPHHKFVLLTHLWQMSTPVLSSRVERSCTRNYIARTDNRVLWTHPRVCNEALITNMQVMSASTCTMPVSMSNETHCHPALA